MNLKDLQTNLAALGFYKGEIDGLGGPQTRAAILAALTSGPDTPLTSADITRAATKLLCTAAHIWTVWDVESSGSPFIEGRPAILFEPHRFSKLTKGRYDRSHPHLSYPKWNPKKYPKTQAGRYAQLCEAACLDPDAAFAACSYGAFQVLGENWKSLGYKSSWDFALKQSLTVGDQLDAFVAFVEVNGLATALRNCQWATFARRYNGTAYAKNKYDVRLAQRFAVRSRA